MARVNPTGLQRLRERLSGLALKGAEAAADVLREKLSGEGSGIHYAGMPRRSSARNENPAEQSGALRDSIAARAAGPCRAEYGPLRNPPDHLPALHNRPPDAGGRPFMDWSLQDRDIHEAVRRATGVKP